METHSRPDKIFSNDPNSKNAGKEFTYWKISFEKYLPKIRVSEGERLDKLGSRVTRPKCQC